MNMLRAMHERIMEFVGHDGVKIAFFWITLIVLGMIIGAILSAQEVEAQEPDSVVVIVSVDTSTVGLVVVPTDTLLELRPGDTAQVTGFILDTTTGEPVVDPWFEIRWFTDSEFVTVDQVTGLVVAQDIQGNRKIRATVYGRVIYVPLPPPDTLPPPTGRFTDAMGHTIPVSVDTMDYPYIDLAYRVPPAGQVLDWSDDFDDCASLPSDGSRTNTGWGANRMRIVPADTLGWGRTGCAALFQFGPDPDWPEQGSDSLEELRFWLDGWYPALWMEWDLFVPANYVHRDQAGGGVNNKFIMLFTDNYAWTGKWNIETQRANISYGSPKYSNAVLNRAHGNWGMGRIDNLITPSDLGQWVRFRVAVDSEAGSIEVWKNGVSVYATTGQPLCPDHHWGARNDAGVRSNLYNIPCGYSRGYILGAANSGFADRTVFGVDNWRITNTDPGW